jgi:hypothetical protein
MGLHSANSFWALQDFNFNFAESANFCWLFLKKSANFASNSILLTPFFRFSKFLLNDSQKSAKFCLLSFSKVSKFCWLRFTVKSKLNYRTVVFWWPARSNGNGFWINYGLHVVHSSLPGARFALSAKRSHLVT